MTATQLAVGVNKQDFQDEDWHTALDAGFDALNDRLTKSGAGDPNGSVAGSWIGQWYYDTESDVVYYCTTTGDAANAVWTRLVPRGVIEMWSGDPSSIPKGWLLADGQQVTLDGVVHTTPDLSGRFIVGYDAGDADYATVGNTGGDKEVTLSEAQMPVHSHPHTHKLASNIAAGSGSGAAFGQDAAVQDSFTDQDATEAGGGEAHPNRPPYYTLAYLWKK